MATIRVSMEAVSRCLVRLYGEKHGSFCCCFDGSGFPLPGQTVGIFIDLTEEVSMEAVSRCLVRLSRDDHGKVRVVSMEAVSRCLVRLRNAHTEGHFEKFRWKRFPAAWSD